MKRTFALTAAALALALAVSGCGDEAAQPDADAEAVDLPPVVQWQEDFVLGQVIMNSGLGIDFQGLKMAEWQGQPRLFEEWRGDTLQAVGPIRNDDNAVEAWVAPQDASRQLTALVDQPAYVATDAALYWLEAPDAGADGEWALYQRAYSLTEPPGEAVLVASGDAARGLPSDWAACDGQLLWAAPADDGAGWTIQRWDGGAVRTLGRFTPQDGSGSVEVALAADTAIWNAVTTDSDGHRQSQLWCADLATDEAREITADFRPAVPLVCGDHLIVQEALDAADSRADLEDADGDGTCDDWLPAPDRLLVYDLNAQAWCWRIERDLPPLAGTTHFEPPLCIDDTHIALAASGSGDVYELPVVDLETGQACRLEQGPNAPFCYAAADVSEARLRDVQLAVTNIQPAPQDSLTNPVTMRQYNENSDSFSTIIYQFNFYW